MASCHQTHTPLLPDSGDKPYNNEEHLSPVPIHVVTSSCQLPAEFLEPSPEKQLVIGFDCEGVDLCRHGTLRIMQLAFPDAIYLVDAIEGGEMLVKACKPALESSYITKVIHDCKRDSEALYFQFGIKLHNVVDTQMVEKLNQRSLWYLAVRGALYCRCFCTNDNNYADWATLPPVPDNLIVNENAPEQEVLSVLDVPPGKMGRVIGRRGVNILSVKESCNAEIVIGGDKGPPEKVSQVFITGPAKQVRKAEAMLKGKNAGNVLKFAISCCSICLYNAIAQKRWI